MYIPGPKERKTRSKHSNVRTGCITCKTRRKKCDEAQPACQNCIRTGRTCDGYAQVPDKRTRAWRQPRQSDSPASSRHHSSPDNPPVKILRFVDPSPNGLSWSDRWHLDYFHKHTAVSISGYFEDAFWCRLVFQMCQGQAAVRHAAISLSARHVEIEKVEVENVEHRESPLALKHIHKSIICLREDLIRHAACQLHTETVLVTCILLTVQAIFQEDLHGARRHMLSGKQLFREWEAVDCGRGSNWEALKFALSQMERAWEICVNPPDFTNEEPHHYLESDETKVKFHLTEAEKLTNYRTHMMILGRQLMERLLRGGFKIVSAGAPLLRGGRTILIRMRFWRVTVKTHIASGEYSPIDQYVYDLAEPYTLLIYLKVSVGVSPQPTESLFDEYLETFQRVVLLCKNLLRFDLSKEPESLSLVHDYVAVALLWCGMKCRDWSLRDEILSLLNSCKASSPWVSSAIVALKKVIQVESHGLKRGDTIPDAARLQCIDVQVLMGGSKAVLSYGKSRHGGMTWKGETLRY
ncbi:hypothetical protein N7517_008159 [Penicillium concentricum]|uniref:Zn(2)-C6 fungal-type domain-containing protein n=1 Tax=Penicillium concentricum TaxID=293559 RepID=A0A9W9V1F1_9EURO|nr:uncharacterized protein N7517_008159 [Penicillium concentricum]KAJ5365273.1 hypothetical protein N7517_008159 [Penicillium concentricum]